MRLTIGRKIALLGMLLYPWFALGGIIGIVAVERTGQQAQVVVDKTQLLHLAESARIALLEGMRQPGGEPGMASLAIGLETVREIEPVLQRRPIPLAGGAQVTRLAQSLQEHLGAALRAAPPTPQTEAAWRASLAAADEEARALIRLLRDDVDRSRSEPYRARATAIVAIAALTVVIVILGGLGALVMGRAIATPLKQLTDASDRVASMKGDLTQELVVGSSDEVGELARAFNSMLATLRTLLEQVREVGEQVTAAAREVAAAANAGMEDAQRQSALVGRSVKGVGAFVEMAAQIATHAHAVVSIAQEALETTQTGRARTAHATEEIHQVQREVEAMASRVLLLGERSKAATDLVRMIEEMSHQTDLLAVNAAIEASKAGEAGEGFRVVAQGVRQLAERSAETTERVRQLLLEIQSELRDAASVSQETGRTVERGVRTIGEAAEAMQLIDAMVDRTAKAAREISQATQAEQRAADGLAQAIGTIDVVTQQGASRSRQMQVQVERLEGLAERLRAAMGEFRL